MSRSFDCSLIGERDLGIAAAEESLRRGDLVVLPTDTAYGLAADAFNAVAVDALVAAKGRGRDLPVPVMVGSWRMLDGIVDSLSAVARELVHAFWPGGLTLVVRSARSLAWDLGDEDGAIAVRMPLHPVALEVLGRTGPLAVSSANAAGLPAPLAVEEASEQLADAVAVYLDAGRSAGELASTVVDVSRPGPPQLLREGAVSVQALRRVAPEIDAT